MPPRDTRARALERLNQRPGVTPIRRGPEPPHPAELQAPDIPSPEALAEAQIEGARELLTRDLSKAPRWAWSDLDFVLGPMLPGDLVVVGALMGNGKSTLLMSQMDALAANKMPTLYVPLEIDPQVCRLRWAAWKLGLDVRHVIRQDWRSLPEGSQEAVDGVLDEQHANPFIHFATPKRMTWDAVVRWCTWAKERTNARIVMVDHFHRLEFGGDAHNHRVNVTEMARKFKDLGRELDLVMLCAAQLNRASDPVDQFIPPSLARLKESAGIGEEADVCVMLSRRLKNDLPKQWAQDLRLGRISERDIMEPATMAVTCRKHRLDDSALNKSVLLTVDNGKLRSRAPSWRQPAA